MKCIILAAGYATRLYPLTEHMPKPLLEIHGRTILEMILDKVRPLDEVDQVVIVSNHKFIEHFREWCASYAMTFDKEMVVLDDGTTANENRLGAVRDIQLAIDELGIDEDILVLAGDNIFEFELVDFLAAGNVGEMSCMDDAVDMIAVHELNVLRELQRTGVAEVDGDGFVVSFEEKPSEPKSNLAVPPFYVYRRETLPLIKRFLDEGNVGDAPGHFVPYLVANRRVKAFKFTGRRYDIGTIESYEEVKRVFGA